MLILPTDVLKAIPLWEDQAESIRPTMDVSVEGIWTMAVIALLIIFIGWVTYTVSSSIKDDVYTEFYILDSVGEAQDLPRQLNMGNPVNITVCIINHENKAMNYAVKIIIDNTIYKEVTTGFIDHPGKWERDISFIPESCGYN